MQKFWCVGVLAAILSCLALARGQTAQLPESIPPSTFASYNSQYERSQLYQTESPIYPPKTTKKMRAPSTVGHYNAQKAESSTTQLLIENTCVCPMPTSYTSEQVTGISMIVIGAVLLLTGIWVWFINRRTAKQQAGHIKDSAPKDLSDQLLPGSREGLNMATKGQETAGEYEDVECNCAGCKANKPCHKSGKRSRRPESFYLYEV